MHPVEPIYLLVTAGGMGVAYILRQLNVQSWPTYIFTAGTISWVGLLLAHLHPALALVFIVPFMPAPSRDTGMFVDSEAHDSHGHAEHSPLHAFEHDLKLLVDFGLFFFGFMNAGVEMASVNEVTWIVLAALVVGKTIGITLFSGIGILIGFPLPKGMKMKELVLAGLVAGLGLTVALFVAGEAFPADGPYQGPAKMGAVLSGLVAVLAIALGRIMRIKKVK